MVEVNMSGRIERIYICALDDRAAAVVQGAMERITKPSTCQPDCQPWLNQK